MEIIILDICGFPPGWGDSLHNGLYGEAPPERGIFFRLLVYKKVGFLIVEVYEKVGRSVIWAVKGPKGLPDEFYGFIKLRKRSIFVIDSYLSDSASFTAAERDAKF